MRHKLIDFTFITIILSLIFLIIIKNSLIFEATSKSFALWKDSLVPVMLPFFVLSELLVNYNFVYYLSKTLSKVTNKLFKINSSSTFVFLMSIFSGIPSSSKYVSNLYKRGLLTDEDSSKIMIFSHFTNPLYIIGTIGVLINNYKIALIILISHYATNIILGLIFRNYNINNESSITYQKRESFIKVFLKSIKSSIETLLLVLGTVVFFNIFSSVLLSSLNINNTLKGLIVGILEMSNGIKYISLLNISINIKAVLISFIISFGGFSIHMQAFSILDNIKAKYKVYLTSRILHGIICSLITYLILFNF